MRGEFAGVCVWMGYTRKCGCIGRRRVVVWVRGGAGARGSVGSGCERGSVVRNWLGTDVWVLSSKGVWCALWSSAGVCGRGSVVQV